MTRTLALPTAASYLMLAALLLAAGSVRAESPGAQMPFSTSATGRQATFPGTDGRQIYERVCQGCHMADGSGARQGPAAYPPMTANPRFVAKIYPAAVIVNGLAAMPAFGTLLDDAQVASVVNYLRGNFANSFADAVSAADVRSLRPVAQAEATELRGR